MEYFTEVKQFLKRPDIAHFVLDDLMQESFMNWTETFKMIFERMVITGMNPAIFPVCVQLLDGNGGKDKNRISFMNVIDIKIGRYRRIAGGWPIRFVCRGDDERNIPQREYTVIAVKGSSE